MYTTWIFLILTQNNKVHSLFPNILQCVRKVLHKELIIDDRDFPQNFDSVYRSIDKDLTTNIYQFWKMFRRILQIIITVQKFQWSDWSNGVQLNC